MNEIAQTLTRLFERHRIVFWYDTRQELQAEYEAVSLPGVEKVILGDNQFGLKYRLLRQQPEQKFLLYHDGPRPENLENWLLDVQLAHTEFRADQTGLWLHELGLPGEFTQLDQKINRYFPGLVVRKDLVKLVKGNAIVLS